MSQRWYQAPWFRGLAWLFGILFVAGHAVDGIFLKDNDFTWHRNAGAAFIEGDPFATGNEWYLLGRMMLNAPLALLPYRVARAAAFVLSLLCLAGTLALLRRMADPEGRLDRSTTFAAAAFSLAWLWPYLSRDFQDCGLQVILLAMLVAGGYALWTGRSLWAGFWFGLAATYKTTPLLFLAVLVWTRRWRAAVAMVAVLVGLNLLPAAYLGTEVTSRCHQKSWRLFQRISQQEDIAENGVEPPKTKNRALMSVFARYLQTYRPGHDLYHEHAAFIQFGSLDHATARHVARGVLLLLGAMVAWRMRPRGGDRAADWPGQLATACIFCGLLSPMCWRHHLILALPAVYLMMRDWIDPARPTQSRLGWLAWAGLLLSVWLPQRQLMGQAATAVTMSYKLDSFALTALAFVVLGRASQRARGRSQEREEALGPSVAQAA